MKNIHNHYLRRIILRAIAVVIVSIAALSASAQKMSIVSFGPDESDQTAMLKPTMKLDYNNGEKCALIKISTTESGFSFDTGTLGVTDVEWQNSEHPAEIWLYVPYGVMQISIQHKEFGQIKDYDLGRRLQSGKTYVMELTTEKVYNLTIDYENEQFLDVDIEPVEARLKINGIEEKVDGNGHYSKLLPFGRYSLRVEADDYYPKEELIKINDKEQRHRLSVRLKPKFGYLNVGQTPESEGAEVFVDDERVGSVPVTQYHLKSGEHKIAVYKKLFKPYVSRVSMSDSATVDVSPVFEPNYAEYEIQVSGDRESQIFVDGERVGTGKWQGRLEAGHHVVEAKKENYRTVREEVDVERDVPRKVSLPQPQPIYGTLAITTYPDKAKVYIDGESKPSGETGFTDSRLIVGRHHVKLVLKGHKTEEFDVDIQEGIPQRIHKDLTDFCNAVIYSYPVANVSLDGVPMGQTPLQLNREAGPCQVVVSAKGYTTYSKRLNLNGTTEDLRIELKRNYVRPYEFYMQGGYSFGGMKDVNIGAGFYYNNVNFEGNYLMSPEKGEEIFWSNGSDEPIKARYKPSGGNVKIGYGIRLNRRMRLTPQAGVAFLSLKESFDEASGRESIADGAKAVSVGAGLRLSFAIAPCVGVSVTPEYHVGAGKSEGFKALSEVSPKIKGYVEGFKCNVSLNLFF